MESISNAQDRREIGHRVGGADGRQGETGEYAQKRR